MYCPKCSQLQVSDDVRFCSRCGFQLKIVSELLATNGEFHETIVKKQDQTPLLRRPGTRIGAKIIFISLFLFIPAFLFSLAFDHPLPLFLPLLSFMIGLFTILYNHLFDSPPAAESQPNEPAFFVHPRAKLSLPATESAPITNELKREEDVMPYQPPSVTENTTKFLSDELPANR
jgi:hypothetical protein